MPWETKFNIDSAIDKAIHVFWTKGYKSTSLSDLLDAMKINKGSFYNTFGSKKSLFKIALQQYETDYLHGLFTQLGKLDDPVDSIIGLFSLFIQQRSDDSEKSQKGCLFVNTVMDLENHDDDIKHQVIKGIDQVEHFFQEQIKLGVAQGKIRKSIDIESTSRTLLTLAGGCRVLAKGVRDESEMEVIKSHVLSLLK